MEPENLDNDEPDDDDKVEDGDNDDMWLYCQLIFAALASECSWQPVILLNRPPDGLRESGWISAMPVSAGPNDLIKIDSCNIYNN